MSKIGYHRQEQFVDYKARYLDALAALFHLHGPCCAAIEYKNQIYLSYNSDPKPIVTRSIKLIDNILRNIDQYSVDNILGLYLTFNIDFIELAKKTKNLFKKQANKEPENQDLGIAVNILNEFIDARGENNLKLTNTAIVTEGLRLDLQEFNALYVNNVVAKYKKILECFEKSLDVKQLEVFLRPFQDSTKLYYSFTNDIKYSGYADTLPNPHNLHTERNIAHHFPLIKLLDPNYIGISRLSCGYCHKYFEDTKHGHRGTHGVCDEDWKLTGFASSPQERDFKDSVIPILEFDQNNPPMQHRRLSTDNFEQKIRFFDHNYSLLEFKKSLNLIDPLFIPEISFDNSAGYTHTSSHTSAPQQILGENN